MTPPLPPLGAENVKIRENSEKIRGPPGDPWGPSTPLFMPLKIFLGPPGTKKVKIWGNLLKRKVKNLDFSPSALSF